MASKAERNQEEEEEGKIPVLTVLKNNAVLKNIFIVNKPPEEHSPRNDHEDILLVGRHPDCDLMLTHPSISRFHLHIRSKPSSRNFSVIDLSSVHGTWVCGRKIEPGVRVEMKEGDTLRIGVSSRVYRLHWIPISHAYDLQNPFVPELDAVVQEDEEKEEAPRLGGEKVQRLNGCPVKMEEIQSMDSILECISSLFIDENVELTVKDEILAAPEMLEDIVSLCCPVKMEEIQSMDSILECISSLFIDENVELTVKDEILAAPEMLEDIVSLCCPVEMEEIQSMDSILESINSLFLDGNVELTVKEEIPAAPQMLENIVSLCCEEERKSPSKEETFGVPSDTFGTETSYYTPTFDGESKLCDSLDQTLSPPYVKSVVECDNTLTENLSETGCLPVVEAVVGTKMEQFQSPQDTFTSPLPPEMENSFEKHCSSWLINTDPASFYEKSDAEVIPNEPESGYTVKDNGRVTDVLTAGAGIFNYENMLLPVEEVIPGTEFQQIKVIEEVAMDSLSDGGKQDTCDQRHSLNDIIVQDDGNKLTASICPVSLQIESVNSSMPQEDLSNITKENQTPKPDMDILQCSVEAKENSTNRNIWSRRSKATRAPQIRTSKNILKNTANVDNEVAVSNENNLINKAISKDLLSVVDGEEEEEEEIFTPDKENFSPNTIQLRFLKKKGKLEEIKHSKSQRSHKSKENFNPDIYSDESISSTLSITNQKDITNKSISKDLFFVSDGEEEEIFTPDKENFSPNTLQLQLLKKKGKLEEIKHSKSQWSQNFGPNICPDESMSPTSNKENQTPKRVQDQKSQRKPFGSHIKLAQEQDVMALKNRVERIPFQSIKNSGSKRRPRTSCPVSAAKGIDVSNCRQILGMHITPSDINVVQKRSWDMVVDTTTLMNKESRKALQLLQGLKGTRLIVPRLVIKELDSLKRQFRLFRRISEASLALEWIEECMVKTNLWIHIQSTVEEGTLTAPTPPASPQTQFGEESWTFLGGIGSLQPLSPHKCSMEIASPTVEDHILDFALLYKRKQNDGQLVLLSEDATLKIKSMAEGLLCEPVQEFRESLVNPFSERFLWTNSSPRGQTWSCQDDVVLRDKYCRLPLRKSSKGAASGLKLILLHNSQYGH